MLVLANAIDDGYDLEPGALSAVTICLIRVFILVDFLHVSTNPNTGIDVSPDSLPVKSSIYYVLLGMLVMNYDGFSHRSIEGDSPDTTTVRNRATNPLIIDCDLNRLQLDCKWQFENAQLRVTSLIAILSDLSGEGWPLSHRTLTATVVAFFVVIGIQSRQSRVDADQLDKIRRLALVLTMTSSTIASSLKHYGPFLVWISREI